MGRGVSGQLRCRRPRVLPLEGPWRRIPCLYDLLRWWMRALSWSPRGTLPGTASSPAQPPFSPSLPQLPHAALAAPAPGVPPPVPARHAIDAAFRFSPHSLPLCAGPPLSLCARPPPPLCAGPLPCADPPSQPLPLGAGLQVWPFRRRGPFSPLQPSPSALSGLCSTPRPSASGGRRLPRRLARRLPPP